METKSKSKTPVAPKIKELRKGESTSFPANRYNTVNSSIYMVELATGKKFIREKNGDSLNVTRLS